MGTYDPVPGETVYGLPVYKKRGTDRWLQCSAGLSGWLVQPKDCRHTNNGFCFSPHFFNIYECKLPHEMTGQWSISSKDNILIDVDVKITTLPSSTSTSQSASSGSALVSPV